MIKAIINEISKKAEKVSQVLELLDISFRLSNEYFSELSNILLMYIPNAIFATISTPNKIIGYFRNLLYRILLPVYEYLILSCG
jgi:hypothetical protein